MTAIPVKPPRLIGLTGYAGTGKDSVRAALEHEHGFTGLAFAEPMRGMLRELLTSSGIGADWMDERALKEAVIPALGVSYRHLAQTLGTEWGRALHPDFWLRIAGSFIADRMGAGATCFVVSDVRFVNEAGWVRAHGGAIWRVHRPSAAPVRAHQSEAEVDDIRPDWTLHNTGSLADLRELVGEALEAWL
ncbi:MAG: deoxynucleotide monophosphate kinase [Burkholderiaceae bacterium]